MYYSVVTGCTECPSGYASLGGSGACFECEAGKYNPLAIRAFNSMAKAQSRQAAQVLDLAERSLRLEMGLVG